MPQPTSRHSDEMPDRSPSQERSDQHDTRIDIEALADRVYRLMREEARLERARGVSVGRQRRKR
ncbi:MULTISPECIES: hypothetical protein [Roseiflexus]|uniref:hypothetical protein n=1 Tax=Roseiflexus TaxID=120961 RepID=UPI0012EE4B73|nr:MULTISPECIES: hypothetical protein [Roseiflexus]GIW01878.1 MAG: hypothetical protein KatS3mg058_3281 [Roseiflexus sp.]